MPGSESDKSLASVPRVLVVEDYWLVAMQAQAMLEDLGCEVIGPVNSVLAASEMARDAELSGAILDVSLGREYSYPVAEILAARNIPFAFATGYAAESLPEPFRNRPCFTKPYSRLMVDQFLRAIDVDPDVPGRHRGEIT